MGTVYAFSIVVGVLLIYIVWIKAKQKLGKDIWKTTASKNLPYKLKESILSKSETVFFKSFSEYYKKDHIIFTKVSLKDIFYIGPGTEGNYMKHFSRISQKHVDFLICSKDTCKPIFAIELDDISHNSKKVREKDEFKNNTFETAGLLLIRIKAKKEYTKKYLDEYFTTKKIKEKQAQLAAARNENTCPNCGAKMILQKAIEGLHGGNPFYRCLKYPDCDGVILLPIKA
ncbi:MAG: DUF2726 domain-containing protein [Clostridiales bacterium]|nr:DUF2726 domain-containing protein [Clostridiales bacterium]